MDDENIRPDANGTRRYDAEMIADFFEHLKWEVRVRRAEHAHLQGRINPELQDALRQYYEKWNSPGLVMAHQIRGGSPEEREHARQVFHNVHGQTMESALEALEMLTPLIEDAVYSIRKGAQVLRDWRPHEVLEEYGEWYDPDRDA